MLLFTLNINSVLLKSSCFVRAECRGLSVFVGFYSFRLLANCCLRLTT